MNKLEITAADFYLRELEIGDYLATLNALNNHLDVLKYSAWQDLYSPQYYPYFFSKIIHEQSQPERNRFLLAVFDGQQKVVGACSLTIINKDILMFNPPKHEALLVFTMFKKDTLFNGLKLLAVVLEFSFKNLNLNRIVCMADCKNIALQHSLHRVGFTKEALLKEYMFRCGAWYDHFQYAILDKDFQNNRLTVAK